VPILETDIAEERDTTRVLRQLFLSLSGVNPKQRSRTVWFEFKGDYLPPPLVTSDFAVVASLFYAMRHGHDLLVHGSVSSTLLSNLEEFQRAWLCWCPDQYRPVEIVANQAAPERASQGGNRAVCVFSGGVDGSFTLARHASGAAGHRTRSLQAALLIQGFDIPLQ
jgi:hypothetical protein